MSQVEEPQSPGQEEVKQPILSPAIPDDEAVRLARSCLQLCNLIILHKPANYYLAALQETPFEDAPEEAQEAREAPDAMSVRSLTGRTPSYARPATNDETEPDRDESPKGTVEVEAEAEEHKEAEVIQDESEEGQEKSSSPRLSQASASIASLDNVNLDDDNATPRQGTFPPGSKLQKATVY
jgi:hypothetical protein